MAPPFRSYFVFSGEVDLRFPRGWWSTLGCTFATQPLADRAAANLHEPGPQESQSVPRDCFLFSIVSIPPGLSGKLRLCTF